MKDVSTKTKRNHIWSGQDVLTFRLFEGLWTRSKINEILKALSTKSQDKLIWIIGFEGLVTF